MCLCIILLTIFLPFNAQVILLDNIEVEEGDRI